MGPGVVYVVRPSGVWLLGFFCSGVWLRVLLGPHFALSHFLSPAVCTRSGCFSELGILHANQTSVTLEFFSLTVPGRCFFCGSFSLFVFRVCLCHTILPVPYLYPPLYKKNCEYGYPLSE